MADGLKATTSLDELAELLRNNTYTPQTDAQRRQQAESLYKNNFDAAKLAAQQSYDNSVLALNNQLNDLQTGYDRQAENQRLQTARSIANADRQALSRGMQRSSYNNATLSNIDIAGNKALAQIEQNRTNDLSDIDAQKALLANQLQQNLNNAQSSYETNVLNRVAELQDQDYQRRQAWQDTQNELLLKLYSLQKDGKAKSTGSTKTPPKDDKGDDNDKNTDAGSSLEAFNERLNYKPTKQPTKKGNANVRGGFGKSNFTMTRKED